ncbi:MAG: class II aldolase/adducin family protein [Desertimonas sp.]
MFGAMRHHDARHELIDHQLAAFHAGLSTGTSGNLSIRLGDEVLITPSGLDPRRTGPEDLCLVTIDGAPVEGHRRPSSELPMHLAVYARGDANAIVHTHSEYATAVSLTHDELPAVHYNINGLGGPVRVAPYATFGTDELAANIAAALVERSGAILQNHGAITIGDTVSAAYERSLLLEWLCALFWRSLQIGTPRILGRDELQAVRDQAERLGYGRHDD